VWRDVVDVASLALFVGGVAMVWFVDPPWIGAIVMAVPLLPRLWDAYRRRQQRP
jgi:hypothetical protein